VWALLAPVGLHERKMGENKKNTEENPDRQEGINDDNVKAFPKAIKGRSSTAGEVRASDAVTKGRVDHSCRGAVQDKTKRHQSERMRKEGLGSRGTGDPPGEEGEAVQRNVVSPRGENRFSHGGRRSRGAKDNCLQKVRCAGIIKRPGRDPNTKKNQRGWGKHSPPGGTRNPELAGGISLVLEYPERVRTKKSLVMDYI